MSHADTRGIGNGVTDRSQWRNNRRLTHAAHTVRVQGVGYFQDLGIDEGKVRANRYAVVQKAWILQPSVVAVNVFLIQRPTDALRGAALELTLNIVRVDRLTRVLDNGVTNDG